MLEKMKDKFDVRHQGQSINIQSLDITSYLSAPNRINTRNSHIGTVYRIFPDFSDMTWFDQYTVVYSRTTHELDKILLDVFDSETGQVRKDENNLLKIQEVIDWPISTGLRGGKEWKSFFKWASPFNNYHPDTKDEKYLSQGVTNDHHLIRYQTGPFYEFTCSINHFTQDEMQFLNRYRWLRQLPDFFKPLKLFENACERTIKELQSFELSNNKIHCKNVATLVPYVKRLLHLFPGLKDKITEMLDSLEIRKKVYDFETDNCMTKTQHSPLDFDSTFQITHDFLSSGHQVWLLKMNFDYGLIKVCSVLRELNEIKSYTVLEMSRLLAVNSLINYNTLLSDLNQFHLLVVACDMALNYEVKNVVKKIFDILTEKDNIKFIFITESDTNEFSEYTKEVSVMETEDCIFWRDLTTASQQKLLERPVKFQGHKLGLKELVTDVTKLDLDQGVLLFILKNELPEINAIPVRTKELQQAYGIDQNHRKLELSRLIKVLETTEDVLVITGLKTNMMEEAQGLLIELLDDQQLQQFLLKEMVLVSQIGPKCGRVILIPGYLNRNGSDEFDELCCKLYNEPHNYLTGCLEKLKVHWVTVKKYQLFWMKTYDFGFCIQRQLKLHSLEELEELEDRRFFIIADAPGMGKSTFLTQLSRKMLKKAWIIRINFSDLQAAVKTLDTSDLNLDSVSQFLSDVAGYEQCQPLQSFLLRHILENKTEKPLLLLFDGFDEIEGRVHKDKMLELLTFIKKNTSAHLKITTREIDIPDLQLSLSDTQANLDPVLVRFEAFQDIDKRIFLQQSWYNRYCLIFGKTNCDDLFSVKATSKFKHYVTSLFFQIDNILGELDSVFMGIPLQMRLLAIGFQEDFEKFAESDATSLPVTHFERFTINALYQQYVDAKYGLYLLEKAYSDSLNEGSKKALKTMYTKAHRQFALQLSLTKEKALELLNNKEPFFRAEDLSEIGIMQLIYNNPQFLHVTFQEFFVADFLFNQLRKPSLRPSIQTFLINDIFPEAKHHIIRVFLNNMLKGIPISDQVYSECGKMAEKLWSSAGSQYDVTFFYQTCKEGHEAIADFLTKSFKELSPTLKSLVLARDKNKQHALHHAARGGSSAVAETLLISVKNQLSVAVFENLTESPDKDGLAPLHLAAIHGKEKFIKWFLPFLRSSNRTLVDQLDRDGYTALHRAAENGQCGAIEALLENGASIEAVGGRYQETCLHLAAQRGQLEVVRLLLQRGANVFRRNSHDTILHRAVSGNNIQLVSLILDTIKEISENDEELVETINAVDQEGDTPLMWAAEKGKLETVQELIKARVDVDINNPNGLTALNWAAKGCYWKIVVELLDHGANARNLDSSQRGELAAYVEQNYRTNDNSTSTWRLV